MENFALQLLIKMLFVKKSENVARLNIKNNHLKNKKNHPKIFKTF